MARGLKGSVLPELMCGIVNMRLVLKYCILFLGLGLVAPLPNYNGELLTGEAFQEQAYPNYVPNQMPPHPAYLTPPPNYRPGNLAFGQMPPPPPTFQQQQIQADRALQQELLKQAAQQRQANFANYMMQNPASLKPAPIVSKQPQLINNLPFQVPPVNAVSGSYVPPRPVNYQEKGYEGLNTNIRPYYPVEQQLPLANTFPQQTWAQGTANTVGNRNVNYVNEQRILPPAQVNPGSIPYSYNHLNPTTGRPYYPLEKQHPYPHVPPQTWLRNANSVPDTSATNLDAIQNLYKQLSIQHEKKTPPDNNMRKILFNQPGVRKALIPTSTDGKKRYAVIHSNGTVEHIESLDLIAEQFPEYILVKTGLKSDDVGNSPKATATSNSRTQSTGVENAVSQSGNNSQESGPSKITLPNNDNLAHPQWIVNPPPQNKPILSNTQSQTTADTAKLPESSNSNAGTKFPWPLHPRPVEKPWQSPIATQQTTVSTSTDVGKTLTSNQGPAYPETTPNSGKSAFPNNQAVATSIQTAPATSDNEKTPNFVSKNSPSENSPPADLIKPLSETSTTKSLSTTGASSSTNTNEPATQIKQTQAPVIEDSSRRNTADAAETTIEIPETGPTLPEHSKISPITSENTSKSESISETSATSSLDSEIVPTNTQDQVSSNPDAVYEQSVSQSAATSSSNSENQVNGKEGNADSDANTEIVTDNEQSKTVDTNEVPPASSQPEGESTSAGSTASYTFENLTDDLLKILFVSSMATQSDAATSAGDTSKKPPIVLNTADPEFWSKLIGESDSMIVYFLQVPNNSTETGTVITVADGTEVAADTASVRITSTSVTDEDAKQEEEVGKSDSQQ